MALAELAVISRPKVRLLPMGVLKEIQHASDTRNFSLIWIRFEVFSFWPENWGEIFEWFCDWGSNIFCVLYDKPCSGLCGQFSVSGDFM